MTIKGLYLVAICKVHPLCRCELSQASFLKGQTWLKLHLGQVGPKKFESLLKGKNSFLTEISNFLLGPSATQVLSVPSENWPLFPTTRNFRMEVATLTSNS